MNLRVGAYTHTHTHTHTEILYLNVMYDFK
jgi:hypothetical protein